MISFTRKMWPLLDLQTRRKLLPAAAFTVGLALLEALGLALMLPLIQLLVAPPGSQPPSAVTRVSGLLGNPSTLHLQLILAASVFSLFVVKGLVAAVTLRHNVALILHSEARMEQRLLDGYLHMPYAFHLRTNSSELQHAIQQTTRWVYNEVLISVVVAFGDGVVITLITTIVFIVNPLVALGAGAYFALVAFVYSRLIQHRARRAGVIRHRQMAVSYLAVQQSLVAIREVKLRHREDFFIDTLYTSKVAEVGPSVTVALLKELPRYYLEVALIIGVGLMATALYSVDGSVQATALLGLFLAASIRALPAINRFLVGFAAARAGTAALDRLASDLAAAEAHRGDEAVDPPPVALTSTHLVLTDIDFTYDLAHEPTLTGINCEVRPGEAVAFVGRSGAGKSTLLDVMLGLLEPHHGLITVGGMPLDAVRREWQGSIGYVPQTVALLDGNIRDNVVFGDPSHAVDDDQVWDSLRSADLASFVHSLPDQLDTQVGEAGVRLSGGQRQRLGLARALFPQPRLLFLDEATSALDAETETRIVATIESLKATMGVVIVTHRLATARFCNRIYLLDHGRIAASGTFKSLLDTSPEFAHLVLLAGVDAPSRSTT